MMLWPGTVAATANSCAALGRNWRYQADEDI